jgi:hypothetical protein
MQLHEVEEIKELFLVEDVNEALQLQEGWRIVAVTTSAETGSGESAPVACYVLGRKRKKSIPVVKPLLV